MKIILALIIGLFGVSMGCGVDVVAPPAYEVVYRNGYGYGYYHQNGWIAAPPSYRYYNHATRPYYRGGGFRGHR